jgi:hypothetical protein
MGVTKVGSSVLVVKAQSPAPALFSLLSGEQMALVPLHP